MYDPRDLTGRRLDLFQKIMRGCSGVAILGQGFKPDACWIWCNGCSGNGRGGGYGRISVDGQMMAVHRVMWMIWHGPIHSKRQVDHTCRTRRCCNPRHLEATTHKANQKRRDERRKKAA